MAGVRNARLTARRAAVPNHTTRKIASGHNGSGIGRHCACHDDEPNRLTGCAGALLPGACARQPAAFLSRSDEKMKTKTTPNRLLLIAVLAGALSGTAHAETAPAVATVATVNGTPITGRRRYVAARVRATGLAADPPGDQESADHARAGSAGRRKANYADKPEVKAAVQQAKTNAEVQLYLRDNVKPEPVTEEQVKARYDELVAALGRTSTSRA